MSTNSTEKTEKKEIGLEELNRLLDISGPIETVKNNVFNVHEEENDDDAGNNKQEEEERKNEKNNSGGEQGDNKKTPTAEELANLLNPESEEEENEEENSGASASKAGERSYSIKAIKTLVKDNVIMLFEDEKGNVKNIEDYTEEEIADLIQANIVRVQEKAPVEFFKNLSPELQYAAAYEAKGGTEMKKIFRLLAEAEEVKDIDIKTESGQEQVIRAYLTSTGYGSAEEIEDEVTALKDRKELEKKATQFKPKLDARNQERIQKEIQAQEKIANQKKDRITAFNEGVYSTIAEGEINGLKIDKNVQGLIYNTMTSGFDGIVEFLKQTQVKLDLPTLAEVIWLAKDPKGYKAALSETTNKETNSKTFQKLKTTEQSSKMPSDRDTTKTNTVRKTIKKQVNFFART